MAHRGSGASLRSTSLRAIEMHRYHARSIDSVQQGLVYGVAGAEAKNGQRRGWREFDEGDVESLLASLRRLRPTAAQTQEAVRQAIGCSTAIARHFRYARFRRQQLFVGSGVMC